MKNAQFIGIVGHKKSGKTTLIELLAGELCARGLKIGTIKYTSHELEFDTPGKDTYRHRVAGADLAMIKSKSQMAIFTDAEYLDDDILNGIFRKCDFVFIEGDSRSANPKICVADERGMRDNIAGEIIAIWGKMETASQIRHFEKEQIRELCDLLINRRKI